MTKHRSTWVHRTVSAIGLRILWNMWSRVNIHFGEEALKQTILLLQDLPRCRRRRTASSRCRRWRSGRRATATSPPPTHAYPASTYPSTPARPSSGMDRLINLLYCFHLLIIKHINKTGASFSWPSRRRTLGSSNRRQRSNRRPPKISVESGGRIVKIRTDEDEEETDRSWCHRRIHF